MAAAGHDVRAQERHWRAVWEREGCYRAPERPAGPKFFNYDSGPFPNGPLHMGHVRTYVLGDVTARYQRALGRSVLYCTEWDAFGMPNEREAIRRGISPLVFTRRWIGSMASQMRALGISYDWSRVVCTCDPAYYRWTQWLFLELYRRGLCRRSVEEVLFCVECDTALSRLQVEDSRCWRCHCAVETRRHRQWFIELSRYESSLLATLNGLDEWSAEARSQVRGVVHGLRSSADGDWLVSRQRAWGTPIPIVDCGRCGTVPVAARDLPVRLPEDLDWSLGSRALASHRGFLETACPRCGGPAERETDTLDCFFDDIWCFMACLVDLEGPLGFDGARLREWMPVDHFHSGFDTVAYLHLHRFLGAVLGESGALGSPEPIRGHVGHGMVLARGRKMSKHLGNAISPSTVLRRHGADALRVAILWAAVPRSAIEWRDAHVERATNLLGTIHRLYEGAGDLAGSAASAAGGTPSRAAEALADQTARSLAAVGTFVGGYRPNAAIEELARSFRRLGKFLAGRAAGRLLTDDLPLVRQALADHAIALGLFAPHLAEQAWSHLGEPGRVVTALWPGARSGGDDGGG